MKTFIKTFYSLLLVAMFSLAIATAFSLPSGPTLVVGIAISFALSFIARPAAAAYGVVLEQWAAYIIERFWKDNGFLRNSYDDSQYVIDGRIVHIPQPGSKPNVVKNRSAFPATAVRRTDTDITYTLDEYTTDPTHIPNIDAIHLSYSKQDSVLGDHMSMLNETIADDMLIRWGTGATMVKTTGGANADEVAPVTGQTGNRLGFHHKDLKTLMTLMNVNKVPKGATDRFVLIDDNMYDYFYDSLSDNQSRDFSRYADAENGVVGRLHNFNIMTRASVLASDADDDLKALGASLAATDNLCSLAWYRNSVARAIGDTKLFQDKDSALYYGDVHSALIMASGRIRRSDNAGVYIIAQGTPSGD